MGNVKSIELVLENCEALAFQSKDVGVFSMVGVTRKIGRIAINSISETEHADEVLLELRNTSNTLDAYTTTWSDNEELPFDRIQKYADITSIVVGYEDGSEDQFYVDWNGASEYSNEYQTCGVDRFGNLYLVISRTRNVNDVFKDALAKEEQDPLWDLID